MSIIHHQCVIARSGLAQAVYRIDDATISDVAFAPSQAFASIVFRAGGTVDYIRNQQSDTIPAYNWVTPTDWVNEQAHEIRCTVNSGAVSGDPTGSWRNMLADRSWNVVQDGVGTNTANLTIEIRQTGGSIVASGTVTLDAEVTN